MSLTLPSIFDAQNTPDNQRLVAAQARSYSDAKSIFATRVAAVATLGLASAVISIAFPEVSAIVGGVGGLGLFALALIARSLERRHSVRAAAIQEQFDTTVFQLPWNKLLLMRPSSIEVSRAAKRYKGGRRANWYDPTDETRRPMDILICQEANLGWAASMHWIWAWMLVTLTSVGVVAIWIAGASLQLTPIGVVVSLLVPFLALFKETIEQIFANFEASREKRSIEAKIVDYWQEAIEEDEIPSLAAIRAIQDRILQFRLSNPYVPDFLDSLLHRRNEDAMRSSVADRNEQARRAGLSG
jgi:hypothetical protein